MVIWLLTTQTRSLYTLRVYLYCNQPVVLSGQWNTNHWIHLWKPYWRDIDTVCRAALILVLCPLPIIFTPLSLIFVISTSKVVALKKQTLVGTQPPSSAAILKFRSDPHAQATCVPYLAMTRWNSGFFGGRNKLCPIIPISLTRLATRTIPK